MSSRRENRTHAVPLTRRTAAVLVVASIGGLVMLGWPLLLQPGPGDRVDPPFIFLVLLPVVLVVVLAEISEAGLDPRVLAVLGVLSAVIAVLRGMSAGTGGIELVFFLLILAGRSSGRLRLRPRVHRAARLGPDDRRRRPVAAVPDAGLGLGRDGCGPAPTAPVRRGEIVVLALYGVLAAYVFGALMNLSGWPFLLGIGVPGVDGNGITYVPGAPIAENLRSFAAYTLITSTGSFDTGRAITNAVAIVLLGPAVLTTLRRAARRATISGTVTGPAGGPRDDHRPASDAAR